MYLVGLNLGIITGERNIKEVLLFSQFSEGNTNVRLKVVPLEAELFGGPHGWSWTLEPVSSFSSTSFLKYGKVLKMGYRYQKRQSLVEV